MSLLHKQIAERARLNPHQGGMPLEMVTHPLTLLVSAVAGEMGSKPLSVPLKANVGAIFYLTRAEMIERGRPTNQGIQELNADIRRTLVYADPVLARETAAEARKDADSEWAKLTHNVEFLKALADRLDAEAKINEDRASGKDPTTVKNQIAFSVDFAQFKTRWDDYYVDVVKNPDAKLEGQNGSNASDTIDLYDKEYRSFIDRYASLGFKPSHEPPKKSTEGDTVGPIVDDLKKITSGLDSIVKPILYGGLALGAGLLVVSLYRPGPSAQPAR